MKNPPWGLVSSCPGAANEPCEPPPPPHAEHNKAGRTNAASATLRQGERNASRSDFICEALVYLVPRGIAGAARNRPEKPPNRARNARARLLDGRGVARNQGLSLESEAR